MRFPMDAGCQPFFVDILEIHAFEIVIIGRLIDQVVDQADIVFHAADGEIQVTKLLLQKSLKQNFIYIPAM